VDSFTYKASDGTADSNVATVNLSISPVTPGTSGDDSFTATGGNQQFNGGLGVDQVTFNFNLTDAAFSFSDSQIAVDGPGGSHTVLTGIEVFKFADGTVNNADTNSLVDDLFYYANYHDVWLAGADADTHYAAYGWHEGRNPNAFFDTKGYLANYTDVKAAGVNPLDHYDTWGWREGRDPSAVFDTKGYLAAYPDVKAAGVNPLTHFLLWGEQEGRHAVNDGHFG
jgi:serralysin